MSVHQYWVAYDISNDRERTRVEHCVSRYGRRLQKSLFVCVLDLARRSKLLGELEALGCRSGFVVVGVLGDPGEVATIGDSVNSPTKEGWIFEATSPLE